MEFIVADRHEIETSGDGDGVPQAVAADGSRTPGEGPAREPGTNERDDGDGRSEQLHYPREDLDQAELATLLNDVDPVKLREVLNQEGLKDLGNRVDGQGK